MSTDYTRLPATEAPPPSKRPPLSSASFTSTGPLVVNEPPIEHGGEAVQPYTYKASNKECDETIHPRASLLISENNRLGSIHAIHGQHRHVAGRWHSKLEHVEAETGQLRRRLELLERQGGERYSGEPWKLRVKMCDVYNERALTLLRGSGFVEAYHLLQAALELSLYTPESGHLCTLERGIGCLPAGRGTRLTALTLNNLGVYHRRKGGGRGAYQHLKKAEEIEGDDPAVSTQTNLCVIATELGMLRAGLAHFRAAVRRVSNEVRTGVKQPTERAAVVAVAGYNLGCALEGVGARELQEANLLGAPAWCYDAAIEMAYRDLGYNHPISNTMREPILTDSSHPRRVKLGRTILGQRVDGSTYSVGWPHFTLIDCAETTRKKAKQQPNYHYHFRQDGSKLASQTASYTSLGGGEEGARSPLLAGMGPPPPFPPEQYYSSTHLAGTHLAGTKEFGSVTMPMPMANPSAQELRLPPPPATVVKPAYQAVDRSGQWSLEPGMSRQVSVGGRGD